MDIAALVETLEQSRPTIVDEVMVGLVPRLGPDVSAEQIAGVRHSVDQGIRLIGRDLAEDTNQHYAQIWSELGRVTAQRNTPTSELIGGIRNTGQIVVEHLAPLCGGDASATRALIERVYAICDRAMMTMLAAYGEARDEIIQTQTAAIQELSAPIIPIYSNVLVLPLIGAIDSMRAATIMASLLEGVSQRNASIVLLDITGVPVVDTSTAHHLIQAARAVRLLGAEIVLVGISPEIAQTIVQLGVNLNDLHTKSDLQAGFAYALERMGLRVVATSV
jgi:rsbT co-antagonist protein RsbR